MADAERQRSRTRRSLAAIATVPIVLVGAIAALRLHKQNSDKQTPGADSAEAQPSDDKTAVPEPPKIHRVELGETVSEIATLHGLSTADVLARNGLSWKTPIFPGQVLRLSGSAPVPHEPSPRRKKAARIR